MGRCEDRPVELDHLDKVTAGAVGEPGDRTFYSQARSGPQLVTVTVEKESHVSRTPSRRPPR